MVLIKICDLCGERQPELFTLYLVGRRHGARSFALQRSLRLEVCPGCYEKAVERLREEASRLRGGP